MRRCRWPTTCRARRSTGLSVQACGDAHLGNFGLFGSAERRLVFDINDFDETLPGPWEWDVKRLTASLEIAARENGLRKRDRTATVKAAAARYRTAMREFAGMSNLDVFYASADIDAIKRQLQDRLTSRQQSRLAKGIAKAHSRDSMQALQKLTRIVDGKPQIVPDPPLVIPLSSLLPDDMDRTGLERGLLAAVESYKRTLTGGPQVPARSIPVGHGRHRPQGGRCGQRRHPLLDHAHARPGLSGPALLADEGGGTVGAERLRRPRAGSRTRASGWSRASG